MNEVTDEEAIEAAARHLIAKAVRLSLDLGYIDWEDYADASEPDWSRVGERAKEVADSQAPLGYHFKAAMEHLGDLAAGRSS